MNEDMALLQLMQTRGLGSKTLSRLLTQLAREERPIEDLLSAPRDELVRRYALRTEIAAGLGAAHEQAARLSDLLQEHGVRVITISMPQYPAKLKRVLRDSAPPVLFISGNADILMRNDRGNGVGICGSRNASDKGLSIAGECARTLADNRINIISGYANGIDLAAHRGALEARGVTTLVLAEGILHFRVKRELDGLLSGSNHVVISEFPPKLGWVARNAMQRNRTICGLSDVVIAVESGVTGGTFAAGETAIELRRPLFVVDYPTPVPEAPGNAYFLGHGASALRVDEGGRPLNMSEVFDALEAQSASPHTPTGQLSLDLR